MLRGCLILCLLCLTSLVAGQHSATRYDLSGRWLVWNGSDYEPFTGQDANAIHFYLPQVPIDSVQISSPEAFSVYINHRLAVRAVNSYTIATRAFELGFAAPRLISVYQRQGVDRLQTVGSSLLPQGVEEANLIQRPSHPLHNFSILATIAMLVFFVSLLYSNPYHTLDFLNPLKLFAVQEREDSVLNSRVSATVNVLFYGFVSLFGGFVLLIILNHAKNERALSQWFMASNFGEALWRWLLLSAVVAGFLIAKLMLLSIMTSLFDWREQLSLHFFNFIRLLILAFVITGMCCLFLFIVDEQRSTAYASLLWVIVVLLILWVLIIAIKLWARLTPRVFHLFSYLCASEFIPVIITTKILLS